MLRLGATALLLAAGTTPAAADAARVRLAYCPNVTHAAALVGVARGTFQRVLAAWARRPAMF
jgi:ABC-type nitrate/sulfonate/bicarbonate transport system substrate-binding protein